MSFEINWYIHHRVLHVHVLDELGLRDVEEMASRVNHFMQDGHAPVHILLDDARGGRPPISLKDLKSRLSVVEHPAVGWVVGIGEVDAIAKFVIPLVLQVMRVNYIRVGTLEEAMNFLKRHDMSLEKNVS